MPENLSGAYVDCYTSGDTYVEATKKALARLLQDGLYPEEVLPNVREMHSDLWTEHVKESWPDYIDSLPKQDEFEEFIRGDGVIYGPFSSYDS